jgi:hypothetical protein
MVVNSVASPVTLVDISQSAGGIGTASGLGGEVNRAPANRSAESVSDEECCRARLGVNLEKENFLGRRVSESDPDDEAGEYAATRMGDSLPALEESPIVEVFVLDSAFLVVTWLVRRPWCPKWDLCCSGSIRLEVSVRSLSQTCFSLTQISGSFTFFSFLRLPLKDFLPKNLSGVKKFPKFFYEH